jgi:ADP-ribose pyrophosphatase YjhB (NUDIX family)
MCMKKSIQAVSAIIAKDNKILLIQRGKEPWKGTWSTPGGKIVGDEAPEEVIVREVAAQIGAKFKPVTKLNEYHFEDAKHTCDTIVFVGKLEGEIKIKKEDISDFKWLLPKDAMKLPMAVTNKQRIYDYMKAYNV